MKPRLSRRSLFSQGLDRIAFAAYFLGAILPLAGLAWQLQLHQLRGPDAIAWAAGLASLAVLSLGAFLALRRAARETIGRMGREQQRLTALLEATGELGRRPDRQAVAQALAHHATRIAQAEGAFLCERDGAGEWTVTADIGLCDPEALLDAPLCESLERVTGAGGPGDEIVGGGLLAVGLRAEDGEAAVLVVAPRPGDAFGDGMRGALGTLAGLASVALCNADFRHAQRNFFAHVTELLTTALDAHLGYHGGHGHRAARLCNLLGHELGLGSDRLQALHFAALLHDVGMLRMHRHLELSPAEWEPHARHGYELLKPIRFWEASAPIVLSHHERWDGTGYPERLAGEDIPLEARILTVCDAYDAMTADSTYRTRVGSAEALAELERCAGSQFDPAVVEAFRRLAERGLVEPEDSEAPVEGVPASVG